MPARAPDFTDRAHRHQQLMALARWEGEGGAGARQSQALHPEAPPLGNAEVVQLQVRMIALENLVIALLAEASDRQLDLVRDMAQHISPRPGFTRHHLTVHAAAEMISLTERSRRFRPGSPG